jgi:hypothetical protein
MQNITKYYKLLRNVASVLNNEKYIPTQKTQNNTLQIPFEFHFHPVNPSDQHRYRKK